MRSFLKSTLIAASLAAAGAANAGVANAFTFATPTVTAVSDRVTYALPAAQPALVTYVGYDVGDVVNNVLVTNTSGNTVNKFTLRFTATVVKPDGSTSTEQLQGLSISSTTDVSSICKFDQTGAANPVTVTCTVQQVRNGQTFPALTVFFLAPSSKDSPSTCPASTAPLTDCNTVKTQVDLIYSEGTNDLPTGLPNSTQTSGPSNLVALGTTNPTFVKTAVPKGLATRLFTGTVPAPGPTTQFTEDSAIPGLPTGNRYARASISIKPSVNDAQCINLGNFTTCPLYETTIVDSTGTKITFGEPVTFLYRIDASNLKRSASQILNNTQIFYTDTVDINGAPVFPSGPLLACTFNTSGLPTNAPCIDTRSGSAPQCFKSNNAPSPGLVGDCQWRILNFSNGFVKFN